MLRNKVRLPLVYSKSRCGGNALLNDIKEMGFSLNNAHRQKIKPILVLSGTERILYLMLFTV